MLPSNAAQILLTFSSSAATHLGIGLCRFEAWSIDSQYLETETRKDIGTILKPDSCRTTKGTFGNRSDRTDEGMSENAGVSALHLN